MAKYLLNLMDKTLRFTEADVTDLVTIQHTFSLEEVTMHKSTYANTLVL